MLSEEITRKKWLSSLVLTLQGDLKRKDFAAKAGVTSTTVKDWVGNDGIAETDPENMKIAFWEALAALKGVSLPDLREEMRRCCDGGGGDRLPKLMALSRIKSLLSEANRCVWQLENQGEGIFMCTLAQFFREQLRVMGVDISSPEAFDRLAKQAGFYDEIPEEEYDDRDRFRGILNGTTMPEDGEIEDILAAIEEIRGEDYAAIDVIKAFVHYQ